MKNRIAYFFFFLSLCLPYISIFAITLAELQDKYKIEIEVEKNKKKPSFGFKDSFTEKKNKKFLPFVVKNEGGVQNKLLKVRDHSNKSSFSPLESESTYKKNNFFNDNNDDYEKEKFYDNEDEDAIIDEILRNLEGL